MESIYNPTLPPGLASGELEMFWDNEKAQLRALYEGSKIRFFELPLDVILNLTDQMEEDKEAMDLLSHLSPAERLEQYYKCKCGGFNHEADLIQGGSVKAEYWNCGENCQCPLKPIFRNKLEVANGTLSPREIEIIKELSTTFETGKTIADKLCISESTYNTHKQSIFRKTGFSSIQQLAVWAHKFNLV